MASLKGRANGMKQSPLKGTAGNILLKTQSKYYHNYLDLRSDDKVIMEALLYVCGTNTNHLIVAGETLDVVIDKSGYSSSTIYNAIVRLKDHNLLMAGTLPYEYIINPLLAIKGSECAIWQFIQGVEYANIEVPSEVQLDCSETTLTTNY